MAYILKKNVIEAFDKVVKESNIQEIIQELPFDNNITEEEKQVIEGLYNTGFRSVKNYKSVIKAMKENSGFIISKIPTSKHGDNFEQRKYMLEIISNKQLSEDMRADYFANAAQYCLKAKR